MSHTYFVEKGSIYAVDEIAADGLGVHSRKDRSQLEAARGPIEVLTTDELLARTREVCSSKPERTTLENWDYSLNVLPPMKWRGGGDTESFMICEAYKADIHPIFVRIGSDYFTFRAQRSLTHDELVKMVREHFKLDN